jgi:hypothetical protein
MTMVGQFYHRKLDGNILNTAPMVLLTSSKKLASRPYSYLFYAAFASMWAL